MTALFFFMIYNFQAGNVRGHTECAHIETEARRRRARECVYRQDPSDYLPDKSTAGFDLLPTSLSVIFFLFLGKTTVMFSLE